MSRVTGLGLGISGTGPVGGPDRTEYVLLQRPLRRILAFTRRSIDDVVNNPIAKNEVLGFYKLHKQIQRSGETSELERQWNSVA
jgi:hypothetical protein